ncbi:MAG: WbqC family protein [Bacteroidota bacterium]
MTLLLHPTYFPNIATMAALVRYKVIWETCDNYQKQTYRNRCYICTDQGKHMLNLPIKHVGGEQGRQKYRDVLLDNSYAWQRQHWRTLQTAYRTSPFFEFYEDDFAPLFSRPHTHLLDFNLQTIEIMCNGLQITVPEQRTTTFSKNPPSQGSTKDLRHLVNAKAQLQFPMEAYTQVFGDRHGFLSNLSCLDLLFNEGPNTLGYLKSVNLPFWDA